jgi:hypothetical protein
MTLIASIKTNQGIVMCADSKEITKGGQIMWTDYEPLLKAKGLSDESEEVAISPKEIADIFRKKINESDEGRIKSTDTGLKLFKIDNFSALLTSGTANPGGNEFTDIIKEIHIKIDTENEKSFDTSLSITFNHLVQVFEKDGDEKLQSQLIFCGYDKGAAKFRTFIFWFNLRRFYDDQGNFKKNDQGGFLEERYLANKEIEDETPLTIKGWVNCLSSLGEFNQNPPKMNLLQGFKLIKRIMELAVTIEEISHDITGIGGTILYAVITEKGFQWVNSESDIMNLIWR